MLLAHPHFQFTHHLPYGAILQDGGVQFVIFSRNATAVRVLLYNTVDQRDPSRVIALDPQSDRWGDVWSVFVPGLSAGQLYHYQADGPWDPRAGYRFDGTARLIDPYAKALAGDFLVPTDGVLRPPKCVVIDDHFDWAGDRHLRRDLAHSVIYEMHVRGFTMSRSSRTKNPGTYLGVIEKIPYLKSLGVTAVELMPVHEFPVKSPMGIVEPRHNYWGYDPMAFFSPHRGYAASAAPGAQVNEFKQMVRALHDAGIEVILDVVFNHTCEGNERGPTLSFKGLENDVYYMLDEEGRYKNYSGCGNTVNGNHPVVREMIFHCLRHWVHNYHVDGFRFDLASILSRDRRGELVPNPPLVEAIGEDPMLADTKIIAEAWDAAGAYQVGTFATMRWAEWNGRYRDDLRRYWRGDTGMIGALATRISGSSDLYQHSGRKPYDSINFITSHDGFTLADLVSYSHKHNEDNGEENRDGDNNNFSHNYGVEGPTRRRAVLQIRQRQVKNMLASLLMSQGVPMIVAGDECGRTQRGNNNAYCQDNALSWFDWRQTERNAGLLRFVSGVIEFRKAQPVLRRKNFLTGAAERPGGLPDVSWYAPSGIVADWPKMSHSLTCIFGAQRSDSLNGNSNGKTNGAVVGTPRHVMILAHAGCMAQDFTIPAVARNYRWRLFIDTDADSPHDIYPNLDGPILAVNQPVRLEAFSLHCYVAAD